MKSFSQKLRHTTSNLLIGSILLLSMLSYSMLPIVTADPLPDSELQALNEYPNWVASQCSATTTPSDAGTSNIAPGPIYIMGDSITALAQSTYQSKFSGAGWSPTINGLVSRQIEGGVSPDGLTQINNDQATIAKANAIVIALGTNGVTNPAATTESQVKDAMKEIMQYDTQNAPIFWVNVLDTNDDAASQVTNQAIADGVGSNGTVIDWYSAAKNGADLASFNGGVHPTKQADIDLLVNLVYSTVSSSSATTGALHYISAGNIPASGEDVGASIFGGKFSNGSWTPTNDVQGGPQPHDDNGQGNGGGSPAGHAAYAELDNGTAMGNLPEHTKLAITYQGKTVIAEKLDVGAGGGPVDGKPRVIDLWWETAQLLDPQGTSTLAGGTDVVNIRAVDPSTPTTPVDGQPEAVTGSSQCACSASGGSLTGDTNAEKAFNYYLGKGLPAVAAAGLVGNFMSESGGDTENIDPTITNGIGAHGIAQWLGSRLSNLVSFASNNNEPEDSLSTQLDFSWQELTGSYASVLSKIKVATSAAQAADIVNSNGPPKYSGGYEGSGTAPTTREANAIGLLQKYGGNSASGNSASGSGGDCSGSTTTTSDTGTYENPLRDVVNLGRSRVDQGVDYTGSGPVYAIGNGTVVNTTNSGWPGGTFIVYKLSDGPAAGKYVYFGENCDNIQVHDGESVTSSTVLCTMVDVSPHIETGWADGTSIGYAAAHDVWVGYDSDSYYTAYGENFSQLLQKLGAPSGIIYPGAQERGSLPSGWPTW